MICNKCKKDVMATIHDLCIECHDDIPRDPIVESVIAKYQKRSAEGMIKYGVTMMRDDLTSLQWLNHLQEELMDATLYLERLRVKLESIEVSKDDEEDLHFKLSEQGYFEQLNEEDNE
jgi:hypothetical protein